MKIIVAVDSNWGIGCDGDLQVRNKEDLKRFQEITTGNIVVLGSKTLDTFPSKLPLKNRINIILDDKQENHKVDSNYIVNSLDEAIKVIKELKNTYPEKEVYIVGGASVYKQFLDYSEEAIVTKWDYAKEADTYFPNLSELSNWEIYSEQNVKSDDGNFVVSTYQNLETKII